MWSSYNLLDGYFSYSNYEIEYLDNISNTPSQFEIKINLNSSYIIKIVSFNRESRSLCFRAFKMGKTISIEQNKDVFNDLIDFFTYKFGVSRVYTYIFPTEVENLGIISKQMELEAILEEQVFFNGKYIELQVYGYNFR